MPTLPLGDLVRFFLHFGCTAYGGLAMVEPLRRRVVEDAGWLSQKEFLDGLALCQLLPGATVVQLAAYVGLRLRGWRGSLLAVAAFVGPAFILILGLSWLYFHFGNLPWVKSLSRGLNAMVIALVLTTLWHLATALGRRTPDLVVAALTLVALAAGLNYFAVLVAAALLRLALAVRAGEGSHAGNLEAPPAPPRSRTGRLALQTLAGFMAAALLLWGLNLWDRVLAQLTWIFLKIGVISFGGGYVMIPILQWEVVDHLRWLTLRQFLDGLLLSYVTPGPLLILAAYVGFSIRGLAAAALATVAVFLPSVFLIIFLSPFYHQIKESRWVRPVLQGILASLVGMLALVAAQLARATLASLADLILMAASLAALLAFKVDLRWLAPAVAAASLLLFGIHGS